MKRSRAIAALVAYVVLACTPLAVAAAPPRPGGRSFWIEAGVALGFIALAQLALQFALIARIRPMSRPFGIDIVMQFHRRMGVLAIGLAAAHAVVPLARGSTLVALLDPARGGWGTMAGLASVLMLIVLVVLSVRRKQLGLGYEAWRVTHALLSVAALAAAQAHVSVSGIYVDVPWKHAVLMAYSGIFVTLVLYLRLVQPALLLRRPYVVAEVRAEAGSTWAVAVTPVGHQGMRFAPGQFGWLRIGGSPWSLQEHPFSFSSSAEDPKRIEITIKELGDFTRRIGAVPIGAQAFIDGPHGSFSIDFAPASGYVFVAGGIGISPILSMLRTLADRKDRRAHVLVYASSRWERTAFRETLASLSGVLDLRVIHVLEQAHAGWTGEAGFITHDLLARALSGNPTAEVFVCGPDPMMSSVERGLRACGVPRKRIHMERFQLV